MDEGANRKKRVLVVDDEPRIGKILSIKLRLYGYEVITTTSGAEAIELVRTKEPDIVLLDMLLPDVAGLEVLGRVRAFSQVPIVVFTAKPDIIQSAMKLGANDSITKPFDPDQVVKKIGMILDSANQKQ
jgi:two-component system KDP operon response regulator KdpE